MRYAIARYSMFVMGCALAVGCADEERPLIEISGQAMYRGTIVPGGTLLLQPGSGQAVMTSIGETGRYQVAVPAGDYKVAVVSSTSIPEGVDPWEKNVKLPPPLVPEKFGRTETSGTSIAVSGGGSGVQTVDINLR